MIINFTFLVCGLLMVSCEVIKACHHVWFQMTSFLFVCTWCLRSVKGYTPLDFAVVGKKRTWKLARMLDDRHLLPRDKFPRLEKCMIEVWR